MTQIHISEIKQPMYINSNRITCDFTQCVFDKLCTKKKLIGLLSS